MKLKVNFRSVNIVCLIAWFQALKNSYNLIDLYFILLQNLKSNFFTTVYEKKILNNWGPYEECVREMGICRAYARHMPGHMPVEENDRTYDNPGIYKEY